MQGFRYIHRVRYADTDQMKVVYHANYLTYFEIGRTEWIRAVGFPYAELEKQHILLPLTHVELDFLLPAHYDDVLAIDVMITMLTKIQIEFYVEIYRVDETEKTHHFTEDDKRTGEKLVTGKTKHVWVNNDFKPARLDKYAPELWQQLQTIALYK